MDVFLFSGAQNLVVPYRVVLYPLVAAAKRRVWQAWYELPTGNGRGLPVYVATEPPLFLSLHVFAPQRLTLSGRVSFRFRNWVLVTFWPFTMVFDSVICFSISLSFSFPLLCSTRRRNGETCRTGAGGWSIAFAVADGDCVLA